MIFTLKLLQTLIKKIITSEEEEQGQMYKMVKKDLIFNTSYKLKLKLKTNTLKFS